MNPCHLNQEEVEYELKIRNIYNTGSSRSKTAMLNNILSSEMRGVSVAPVQSGNYFDSANEIIVCKSIYDNISKSKVNGRNGPEALNICMSRLKHLLSRLERIEPQSEMEQNEIVKLISRTNDCVESFSNISDNRANFPQPTPRLSLTLNQNAAMGASAPSGNIQSQETIPVTNDSFYREARFSNPNVIREQSQGAIRKNNHVRSLSQGAIRIENESAVD